MKSFALFALFLLLSFASFGQSALEVLDQSPKDEEGRYAFWRCGTVEVHKALLDENKALSDEQEFERFMQKKQRQRSMYRMLAAEEPQVIYLPVVVHIIHNGEAVGQGTNLSAAQVLSQIDVLNEDFRRKEGSRGYNLNPVGADVRIEFILAEVDPEGNPLPEAGIHRVNSSSLGLSGQLSLEQIENDVKPFTYWDPYRYLNIWTADLGGDLLGYAQFPVSSGLEGIPGTADVAETDGVVILYKAFGSSDKGTFTLSAPYDKGRTATHEIGHWLGLRHIWGDGGCDVDDYCSDTPLSDAPNEGCPGGTTSCGSVDMIENYMDYTYDGCMNIFTQNQKERMLTVLEFSPRRKELLSSNVIFIKTVHAEFGADLLEVAQGGQVSFTDQSRGSVSSWNWVFEGGTPATSSEQNPVVLYEQAGSFSVSLTVSGAENTHEELKSGYISVYDPYPNNTDPVVVATPGSELLQLGELKELSVAEFFSDADGDALTYTAVVDNTSILDASLNQATLSLNALAAGNAFVLIKADDGKGGVAEVKLEVNVNQSPVLLYMPEDQLLQVDEILPIFLEELFGDADGDVLTYTLMVEKPAVLEAVLQNGFLDMKGLASGLTMVDLKADDGRGGSQGVRFQVLVNQQPEIKMLPEDQWLVVKEHVFSLALSEVFSDPEGAALTFVASPEQEGIITTEIKEEILTLSALKAGAVVLNLKAYDDKEGMASINFQLRGHYAPQDNGGLTTLELFQDDSIQLNLNEYFSDPEGDVLTYVLSGEEALLAMELKEAELKIKGIAAGEGLLQIAVADSRGGIYEKSLPVLVKTPLSAALSLLSGSLFCYPNPFKEGLRLQFRGAIPGRYQLLLLDMQGRIVKNEQWEQASTEGERFIALSFLPQGSYLLKIISEEGISTQRIIKY